jgi:hypothetical protein
MVMLAVEIKIGVRNRHGERAGRHRSTDRKCKSPAGGRGFIYQALDTRCPGLLENDLYRAGAFLALLDLVRDVLSLGQRLKATALDGAVMDEDVLGAVGRGDEAEALFVTEPLNCTCSHYGYLWMKLNVGVCRRLSRDYGRICHAPRREVLPEHYKKTLHWLDYA